MKKIVLCLLAVGLSFNTFAAYKDGTYTGAGTGKGGKLKVQVMVEKGRIADVKILRHSDTDAIMAGPATELPVEMVKQNTPDVADVGGATASSNGIKEAVKNALSKAK